MDAELLERCRRLWFLSGVGKDPPPHGLCTLPRSPTPAVCRRVPLHANCELPRIHIFPPHGLTPLMFPSLTLQDASGKFYEAQKLKAFKP